MTATTTEVELLRGTPAGQVNTPWADRVHRRPAR
jgi:hypothetical protein